MDNSEEWVSLLRSNEESEFDKSSKEDILDLKNVDSRSSPGGMIKVPSKPKTLKKKEVDEKYAMVQPHVLDITRHFFQNELKHPWSSYLNESPKFKFSAKTRACLVDWLISCQVSFEASNEALYLTVNIVDRYLSRRIVKKKTLQLLGVTAFLIATKYYDIYHPELGDLVSACGSSKGKPTYTAEQIKEMEAVILKTLDWRLTVPTCNDFLERFIFVSKIDNDGLGGQFARFLSELALQRYGMLQYAPSRVAAMCVMLSEVCTIKPFGEVKWSRMMEERTGYGAHQLRGCMRVLLVGEEFNFPDKAHECVRFLGDNPPKIEQLASDRNGRPSNKRKKRVYYCEELRKKYSRKDKSSSSVHFVNIMKSQKFQMHKLIKELKKTNRLPMLKDMLRTE